MEEEKYSHIHTPRLQWHTLSLKYVQEIFKEFTDEVTKYLTASTPSKIEEEEQWIINSADKDNKGICLHRVVTDETWSFVWCCGIDRIDTKTPTLGLRIKQSARGKWYGREMIGGLLAWLEAHKDFEYIIYRAAVENVGSRKIAESFGGVIQRDNQGNEYVFPEWKFDKSSNFPAVEYRIYKK